MPVTKSMRVLVTGGGTATSLSVLKGLKNQDEIPVHVVLADAQDLVAGRFLADEFLLIPHASDSQFAEVLEDFCRSRDIQLVIPVVDYEFATWAAMADRLLAVGVRVAISKPEIIELCNDKLALANWLTTRGAPVARIYQLEEVLAGRVEFPLFVKPRRDGRASLGAQRVNDMRELEVACKQLQDPLIQEFIDGQEITVDALCDFTGGFIGAMPRVRMETKAGVSVRGWTLCDPELVQIVRDILEAMPISGPANLQCFRRSDGSLVVSEINPRFAGALALSLASGFNSPLLLLKLTRGDRLSNVDLQLKYGVRMVRYWQEVFVNDDGYAITDPWPQIRHKNGMVGGLP